MTNIDLMVTRYGWPAKHEYVLDFMSAGLDQSLGELRRRQVCEHVTCVGTILKALISIAAILLHFD